MFPLNLIKNINLAFPGLGLPQVGKPAVGRGPFPCCGSLACFQSYSLLSHRLLLPASPWGLLSVLGQTIVFVPHNFQDRYLMLSKVPP